MDENGIMLSVQEVRERLRDGRPVILNEEANWNNQQKITKEYHLFKANRPSVSDEQMVCFLCLHHVFNLCVPGIS